MVVQLQRPQRVDEVPTTAGAALLELLARLGAAAGRPLALTGDELQHWPPEAVAMLKAHAVLRPGKPGDTATCPGCEQACVMPVQQRMRPGGLAGAFIACDKRDDMGRVPLKPTHLERWRADGQTLGDALAVLLGSGACHSVPATPCTFRLGSVAGGAGKAAVQLRFDNQGHVLLELAGHVVNLAAVLTAKDGRLVLDTRHLARCADAPDGGATLAAETAEQRTTRLLARKAALQQRGVKAFLQVLAKEEGVSVSMVKRILGRTAQPAAPKLPAWAAAVTPAAGVSPGGTRKR